MTINRWAAKADPNQKDIIKGLEAAGYTVFVCKRPLDLLVSWGGSGGIGGGGRCALLEIKLPGKQNDFTPAQKKFIPSWKGPIVIATTVDEAVKGLEALDTTL